ncbi:hypothetical protein H9X96_11845 [Pedobacter sp. N36a]|uniref:hypothetical protein n=1 Tax=Pedobacter sp. N36a TaxID=2767996 RepID=UPI0016573E20|nr:hypothetical protein [Pedobacter sp. N36a]MBC8986471.1 hypothetical protein [Pedobacter sp. N36a]
MLYPLSSNGTHAPLDTNNYSFHLLAGISSVEKGFSFAGLSNIVRNEAKGTQIAGLLNTSGENKGAAFAGFANVSRGYVNGVQFAGFINIAKKVIEELGISRLFISSTQRIQNLNIPSFFGNTPFQASLTPGLSSHGRMSSRVINKVSLNVIGGYTAGVDDFEIAGLFNLSKGEVRALQVAGMININSRTSRGVGIAGLANISSRTSSGIQIAGLFNIAKKNTGFQLALLNFSGSSTGTSLGLLNFVGDGYYKISVSSNELVQTNVALKPGNANLYNKLQAAGSAQQTPQF